MTKFNLYKNILVIMVLALCLGSCSLADNDELCLNKYRGDWDYDKDHGPGRWGDLNSSFTMCKVGKHQSPIDINPHEHITIEDEHYDLHYKESELHVYNTGHTIEVEYQQGSYLVFDNEKYHLVQFHFHDPSEHTINGKHFPMEMHLVHKHADGKLLILASFIDQDVHNHFFDRIWSRLPEEKGLEIIAHHEHINLASIFHSDFPAYYYEGSLTTPPCSEAVEWIVLKQPIHFSKKQIDTFKHYYLNNFREVQRGKA